MKKVWSAAPQALKESVANDESCKDRASAWIQMLSGKQRTTAYLG